MSATDRHREEARAAFLAVGVYGATFSPNPAVMFDVVLASVARAIAAAEARGRDDAKAELEEVRDDLLLIAVEIEQVNALRVAGAETHLETMAERDAAKAEVKMLTDALRSSVQMIGDEIRARASAGTQEPTNEAKP